MEEIKIWAPTANDVQALIGGKQVPLMRAGGEWWKLQIPPNIDYSIILDGKQPVADPRSLWQPFGVEGPSRTVDHSSFTWSDGAWQQGPLSSAILYELHVGTFSPEGTFEGIEKYLDHLLDLGITHIELMPVNGFPGSRGWGYDGVNLYAPHEVYGGPEKLKHLVNTCHRRGLGIILDVVYNHLGPTGNYLHWFGPYYSEQYNTPWGMAINFDGPGCNEVRRFFCDNALMWLRDYHFDGLRIDAVHAIYDRSAFHVLEQLHEEVKELEKQIGRHLFLIAESDLNDPRIIRSPEIGGYGIDAQWKDDFHHSLHSFLTGDREGYHCDFGSLSDIGKTLSNPFVYDGRYSKYRHRNHGRPCPGLSGDRFIIFLQNHDQIGNRAQGERLCHLISVERVKVACALLFTSPFIPMLFQGEEWRASSPFLYFTDHTDPEIGRAIGEGRRKEFAHFDITEDIPDPQDISSFLKSKLNWEEKDLEPHRSLLDWHRRLIRLRRNIPDLGDGNLGRVCVAYDEEKKWLIMSRGRIKVLTNLGSAAQGFPLHGVREHSVLLSSSNEIELAGNEIRLPPDSVAIVNQNRDPG